MTRLGTWAAPLVPGMVGGSAMVGLRAASQARGEADEAGCADLPGHAALSAAIKAAVDSGGNGGIANDVWVALVNRDGAVCQVTFSGVHRGAQWSAGRGLRRREGLHRGRL